MSIRPAISICAGFVLLFGTVQGARAVLADVFGKTCQIWGKTNLSAPFSTLGGLINAPGPVTSYANSSTNGLAISESNLSLKIRGF
jgi:hypothetical protein